MVRGRSVPGSCRGGGGQSNMAYILDIAVILIFALAIFIGYKRGFMKTILRLVGVVLALVIASSVSKPAAGWIYDQFLASSIQKQIVAHVPSTDTATLESGLQAAMDQMPSSVINALQNFNVGSAEEIVHSLEGQLTGSVETVAATISDKVIRPVAVVLLMLVCFFVLFIVLLIVFLILASLLSKVFKLPGLRQMDGALGAVLGGIEGVLWVLIAVTVIQLVATSTSSGSFISSADLQNSLLVSKLASINPITSMMDKVLAALPSVSK